MSHSEYDPKMVTSNQTSTSSTPVKYFSHQEELRSLYSPSTRSTRSVKSVRSVRSAREEPAPALTQTHFSASHVFEWSDDAPEQPGFEVIFPLEEQAIGQLDTAQLLEQVNKPIPDSKEILKKPDTTMVLYTQNHPTFFAGILQDLKNAPFLETIETSVFWLDVWGFDLAFLSTVAKILGIHPLTVEDIWHEEHREKCELFEEYTFICLKALLGKNQETGSLVDWGGLYIISTEKYVVTFHMDNLPQFSKVYHRLEELKKIALTPGWILYVILDHVVDRLLPLVDMALMESNSIDELALLVTQHSQNEILGRIGQTRKLVTSLQKLISPKSSIFQMIQSREQKFQKVAFRKNELLYFEDVHSHIAGMTQSLSQQEELLNRAHTAYLTQISVELTQSSNRMGLTMKKFSAGAFVFLPLNLIASILGVNLAVAFPLGDQSNNPAWFWILVIFMIALATTLILIGRRYRWFSESDN